MKEVCRENPERKAGPVRIVQIPGCRDRRRKRAAAYCRVSTELAAQEDSLTAQIRYYTDYIRLCPEWDFAGIYFDEQSGTRTWNRPGFQALVCDAVAGKVDVILVKSVSRFARNIVDCERTLQMLRGNGVDVIFEREGIHTGAPGSSMLLSVLAAVAQDESRSISDNMKWSCLQRVRRGEFCFGNHQILGYDTVNRRLVPNQDAWIVRMVFELFTAGCRYREISEAVEAAGGRSIRGNRLSSAAILRILRNEAYMGDKLLQKQAPKNFLTKKPEQGAAYESRYLTDDHEAIVDRATWRRAQEILRERRERRAGRKDEASGKGPVQETEKPQAGKQQAEEQGKPEV